VVPRTTGAGIRRLGSAEFDREGRYLRADFGNLSVISLYQPSGSSSEQRQEAKFRFMALIYPHLVELASSGRDVIICGDWNIAHQEIDLRNWRGNRRNSGFLPEERAWVSRLLNEGGWCDVYRSLHPDSTGELTPGGRIAARPGQRTSAGGSTINWRRPPSPARRAAQPSTRNSGSATTRR
jgi:exodeoxyribonuclease-3